MQVLKKKRKTIATPERRLYDKYAKGLRLSGRRNSSPTMVQTTLAKSSDGNLGSNKKHDNK
jgi:hypothetical protein